MAIRTVVTLGFGNGTFNGTIATVTRLGYTAGAVAPQTGSTLKFCKGISQRVDTEQSVNQRILTRKTTNQRVQVKFDVKNC